MKKLIYSLIAFGIATNAVYAKQVDVNMAKQVAQNFLFQNAKVNQMNLTVAYTENSSAGEADYFVFNLNKGTGFIIVSAEDAGHPIIGYSTEDNFKEPEAGTNFGWWMENRKQEIEFMRANHLQADAEIKNEWTKYSDNLKLTPPVVTYTVGAICAAKWDQGGAYNDLCPGGSMTGCVATAMAIIMKKWGYPAQGTGNSSYTAGSYGTQSANYGATTYNWANMPVPYCQSANTDVATIMYHCGVSVQMNYSPSGSGAMVCGGNPSAEYSYKTYFGYDPLTLKCANQASYTTANWITTLEAEFDAGRPMQYQGVDASQGGHTWVCDGYDASNNMHMNWGWSGSSNGYYAVTNLAPTGSGLNFTSQLGGLIGIKPKVTAALDAGVASVTTPNGTICSTTFSPVVKIQNFGNSNLTSCTINYHADSNPNQTFAWTGSLAPNASATVTLPSMTVSSGSHTFTSSTSNPNSGTDGNTSNDQQVTSFSVSSAPAALPLQEGFEASANAPAGWSVIDMSNDGFKWVVSTTVGKTGTHSMAFDNCTPATDITGTADRFLTATYDFTNATSAAMTFDVASTYLILNSTTYADTLAVYSSTNCGATWNQMYVKGGAALSTAPNLTAAAPTCFTPTSSQWRNDNINLNSLIGQSSVMFAFENRSGWAEWMYIDNINITAVTGVGDINSSTGFGFYPNPTTGEFTVYGLKSPVNEVTVYNIMGEPVMHKILNSKQETLNLDAPAGMYFIKVSDGDSSFTKKLNKQ